MWFDSTRGHKRRLSEDIIAKVGTKANGWLQNPALTLKNGSEMQRKSKSYRTRSLFPSYAKRFKGTLTDTQEYHLIRDARSDGLTWQDISAMVGYTGAGAWARYRTLEKRFTAQ